MVKRKIRGSQKASDVELLEWCGGYFLYTSFLSCTVMHLLLLQHGGMGGMAQLCDAKGMGLSELCNFSQRG